MKEPDSEKEAAMEAELRAARERAVVPLEARMTQFREMLLERGVTDFILMLLHIFNTKVLRLMFEEIPSQAVCLMSVFCHTCRCLRSPLGTKSFTRLCLTHVTFCSTQKRGNRFSFSLFPHRYSLLLSSCTCAFFFLSVIVLCLRPLQVFDQYVKTRAEEERKEKKNKLMQAKDEFRRMMEDAKLGPR